MVSSPSEPPEYMRYRDDERVLVEIGRWLQDMPAGAELPTQLVDAALAAWQRDEIGEVREETDEQRRVRYAAGTLALIGLDVETARAAGTRPVIDPELLAKAIDAADQQQ